MFDNSLTLVSTEMISFTKLPNTKQKENLFEREESEMR